MMDQYVTFGDLLKIGSFLLDLISVILYIYYNHKNSNQNHHGKNGKCAPSVVLLSMSPVVIERTPTLRLKISL